MSNFGYNLRTYLIYGQVRRIQIQGVRGFFQAPHALANVDLISHRDAVVQFLQRFHTRSLQVTAKGTNVYGCVQKHFYLGSRKDLRSYVPPFDYRVDIRRQ